MIAVDGVPEERIQRDFTLMCQAPRVVTRWFGLFACRALSFSYSSLLSPVNYFDLTHQRRTIPLHRDFTTMAASFAATPFKAIKAWMMGRPEAATNEPPPTEPVPKPTFRPEQISLFSGRPSPYAVPASQAHLLPKPAHWRKLTQEEVEQRLKAKAEAVYKKNIEAGLASEEFLREYRAEKEAEREADKARVGQKRKLAATEHGTTSGRFALDYEDSEMDSPSEGDQGATRSDVDPQTPPAKSRKTSVLQTPQRSAMKKDGIAAGYASEPRPIKSVNFNDNPVASTSYVSRYLGPAGVYTGTTFTEPNKDKKPSPVTSESDTASSLEWSDVISPTTRQNTATNALSLREETVEYDPSYRDPNNPEWRPTPGRPRPTTFRVPFLDEDDPSFMDMDEDEEEEITPTKAPSSPRPAHAALPTSSPTTPTPASSQDKRGILSESSASRLNKAREQAEKYKPKDSSRLSQVHPARSRSTSPPLSSATANRTETPVADGSSSSAKGAPASMPSEPPALTTSPDGSEDDREHEWDEWARNLDWPAPVLRTETGVSSAFMENWVTEHWDAEDDEQSEWFYNKEFKKVDEAFRKAAEMGVEVEFVHYY